HPARDRADVDRPPQGPAARGLHPLPRVLGQVPRRPRRPRRGRSPGGAGRRLGACPGCRGFWAKSRAGSVDSDEIETVEGRLSVTAGTCAVMGTASTMACITEALGMSLPGTAAIPAVHSDRLVAAEETGKAAVSLIESRITPRQVITQKSVENAIRVLMAVGGSTNAIVHLTAIAGRLGIKVSLERFNELS